MRIDAVTDSLSVHVGRTFSAADVERLQEAFVALGPFSNLDIDFAGVRHCDDSALACLASALTAWERGVVRLRGLTVHQWRLLTYAGLAANRH
jgi:anti-anti-sigma regulatory factor